MLDDVDSDTLEDRTSLNGFEQMTTGQKLYALASRTKELKERTKEFDI